MKPWIPAARMPEAGAGKTEAAIGFGKVAGRDGELDWGLYGGAVKAAGRLHVGGSGRRDRAYDKQIEAASKVAL
jgi:hypothetical protein